MWSSHSFPNAHFVYILLTFVKVLFQSNKIKRFVHMFMHIVMAITCIGLVVRIGAKKWPERWSNDYSFVLEPRSDRVCADFVFWSRCRKSEQQLHFETSPWCSSKFVRFGAAWSRVRLSAGSHQDIVNWYCSLHTRHMVCRRWYGLIMHFCHSNHEITRISKRKYNSIKDH